MLPLFLISFLVLFLEIALIRWVPAYIRLLSYFSNFVLLASFLGIGLGCLLAARRARLIRWFPAALLALLAGAAGLRLEVAVPDTTSLYFSSGTAEPVTPVESTLLLPLVVVAVAALFVPIAQQMGRELARFPALRAYLVNLMASLAGLGTFALLSWLELGPLAWFGVAAVTAAPFVGADRRPLAALNLALLAASVGLAGWLARGALWSPYYKITVREEPASASTHTILEVNNIFHQSMAPFREKEYFYEWPYRVFGDRFRRVLILGAGSGTDVAAALAHGAARVDAVEIDPAILRLGAERHPDRPYADPRVRIVCDDARHFLRTTNEQYDLVVFGLIDSLTLQSSFSSVRLESYMFTAESFRAVRDHLAPGGVMVLYNYFREKWLVDRLANTVAMVFGREPLGHVHRDRAYLAVLMAGPGVVALTAPPAPPSRILAYGQPAGPSPAGPIRRDPAIVPATDDWPFLYMRAPHLPRHYVIALVLLLAMSAVAVLTALRATPQPPTAHRGGPASFSWHFFFLGAGFMLLETKSITQFALLWGTSWSSASLAIASVLAMALCSALVASRAQIRRPGLIVAALLGLVAVNAVLPVGRVAFSSRAAESIFYGALVFSPVFCAGLIFSRSFRGSAAAAADFGSNLLGAMTGGVLEYLALMFGYRVLLGLVAACYTAAYLMIPIRTFVVEPRPGPP